MLQLRDANAMDAAAIAALFREVSAAAGGLARRPEEIHEGDIATILERCAERGFATVAEGPRGLLGALYCYAPEPALFARCWSNTTLAVAPETQGRALDISCSKRRSSLAPSASHQSIALNSLFALRTWARSGCIGALALSRKGAFGIASARPRARWRTMF